MLKLLVSKKAQKFLDCLPPKQFRQIVKKVFALLENPRPHGLEGLRGYPFLRNNIGEYRIIMMCKGIRSGSFSWGSATTRRCIDSYEFVKPPTDGRETCR